MINKTLLFCYKHNWIQRYTNWSLVTIKNWVGHINVEYPTMKRK